jgi:hypothetical protein
LKIPPVVDTELIRMKIPALPLVHGAIAPGTGTQGCAIAVLANKTAAETEANFLNIG